MREHVPPVAPELLPATLPVFATLGSYGPAREWLAGLPDLIAAVRDHFDLRLPDRPVHGGSVSWVARAHLPDGTPVIVKISFPHPEMLSEVSALRLWDGRGAVRVIAHDPVRHALLLQPCDPGTELLAAPGPTDELLRAGCAVLRELWQAPVPASGDPVGAVGPVGADIEDLAAVMARWADQTEERMARIAPGYDAGLVAQGVRLMRTLPGSQPRRVVLHGDFNPGNILSAGDGRWLAIDPKPMVGDPAYDPWPLLEQVDDPFAYPDPPAVLRHRLDVLADALGVDARRIALWAVARRVETALWAADQDEVDGGSRVMDEARHLADLGA